MSSIDRAMNPNPLEHMASATLPAAGAFEEPDFQSFGANFTRMSAVITYTRGAAGGYAAMRVVWRFDLALSRPATVDAFDTMLGGTVAPGAPIGTQNVYVMGLLLPEPDSDDPLTFVVPFVIPVGAVAVQVQLAEAGADPTPGDASIQLRFATT